MKIDNGPNYGNKRRRVLDKKERGATVSKSMAADIGEDEEIGRNIHTRNVRGRKNDRQ